MRAHHPIPTLPTREERSFPKGGAPPTGPFCAASCAAASGDSPSSATTGRVSQAFHRDDARADAHEGHEQGGVGGREARSEPGLVTESPATRTLRRVGPLPLRASPEPRSGFIAAMLMVHPSPSIWRPRELLGKQDWPMSSRWVCCAVGRHRATPSACAPRRRS